MFRSLRFRLPALFLAGIVLAGLVAAAISLRLFQSYARDQTFRELRSQSAALTQLIAQSVNADPLRGEAVPFRKLEQGTRIKIFFVARAGGFAGGLFPGQRTVPTLPKSLIDPQAVTGEKTVQFELVPPGRSRTYLAVARPLQLGRQTFGAVVVAKPKTDLQTTWLTLLGRLGLGLLGGLVVAGLLAWYLSRRITRPLLDLSEAADEIAGGRYGVAVPVLPSGDEIAHLSERFGEMATRLSEAEQMTRNFLMSVSHELRTPLTAIRGHVEALREGLADDPAVRAQSLEVVAVESARLERLVGDVLDLAKLNAHRFTLLREEVDMQRLVDAAYAAFGEEARRRRIDYRQEVSAAPVILSDGDRVLQIISNLLRNAFRWTPDGGRIELALDSENGSVSVAVEDTGPGISTEERERIFRPFWSRDDGGTGLGLAIARELALALGGSIELESEPGSGSRFELLLPHRAD
jgi:signal transduction histidine kinase